MVPDPEDYVKKINVKKINDPRKNDPRDDVGAGVKTIIMERTGVNEDRITLDTRFREDLGLYDLDFVELIMAFEERFTISIPEEDAERLRTIRDAIEYIQDHIPD